MDKFMILPSNTDLNRGDQALVWETVNIAKKAGLNGDFYMLANEKKLTLQSQEEGLNVLTPILKHPSRMFKTKQNNKYSVGLIIRWGFIAIIDLIISLLTLTRITRAVIYPFLGKEEKNTLKIMRESKACFVKGGGFIHSSGKLSDSYVIYYQLFHIMLALSFKKPVYFMPNSFGPFHGFGVKRLVKRVFRKCSLITVRESISKTMLSEIGIDSRLFPDLGFGLIKSENSNDIVKRIKNDFPNYKLVAITARPYRFPESQDPSKKYKEYIAGMTEFSKWLYENNFLPVFVEHTLSETTHESDASCIDEIISNLPDGNYKYISNSNFNCRDLKAIYSQMDYVVGTRFHSVIFALSEWIPSVAITYGGNKGKGIMKDLSLSEYMISMDELTFDKLVFCFNLLTENYEIINKKLKAINKKILDEYQELAELL